ncbi:MAG TPA: amino acid adenylation domain-containing protein [Pyrinomonadaceae bacterium]|nr:amino acid adenylation domain-containing protein [Pyrinomonadaceae bacterium]
MTAKAPETELLDQHIAGLSPAKRALLELKLKQNAANAAVRPSIPKRPHHSPVPLSFAQERLWFLSKLEPDSPAYNMHVVRRLSGPLNAKALEQALAEIVKRHESLRTRFEDVGGVPQQVIDDAGEWKLKLVDLSSTNDKELEAQRIASADAQRPFVLAQEWGLRAQLLRLDERDHILVLTMHHIVSDGWSLGVLFEELHRLYEAYNRGERHSPLPKLELQYADFSVWQRDWFGTAQPEKQLNYWKEQLAGATPAELAIARPRPSSPSFHGERQSLRLSPELSSRLHGLARAEGATLFMVMFAAFQALLSRYTGQSDICVGTPVANRNRPELEALIGVFVNTLVLRTDLSGDPRFAELLQRVREVALAGYAHQELPFEKLVDELRPGRTLNRNPLFDVIFAMQNAPRSETKLSGLWWEPWGEGSKTTRVDLEVHVAEVASELVCTFVYATDLFEAEAIQRLMGHYKQLLEAASAEPDRRLSEISLLTSAERTQIAKWNETSTSYPQQCIQHLFETQADQQGSAIAIRCGEEELTYAELNDRANRLAHYLQAHGVGPETRVGICLERSTELVVALLGILKAGGAYLPLDANYPAERLAYMLDDAQPLLLLTHTKFESHFSHTATKIVCLDAASDAIAGEPRDNPPCRTTLENLAYVMYTSGSTGYPKGVAVTHRNVVRLVKENNYASLNADEVFLQFAPLTFDASTLEVWGPLLNGGRLVVFPPFAPTLEELSRTIEENRVSTLWLTAGLFHQLVDEHPQSLARVRQVLAGGDVLSVPHVEKALRFMNGNSLINGYGPTENTTFTCCHLIKSSTNRSIPIGRPLANTQVYVLDENYQPVPIGVPGELYVGGDGLARGYLNRPGQTAERFIPNVFSSEPGARLYRTGDVVRYLPGGELEFIHRVDQQVKIRGFRIEPGEVEHVLARHPSVAGCAVNTLPDHAGDKFLAAYVVVAKDQKLEASDLRAFLRTKVPEYMMPAAFAFIDALPLTDNGKIDRRALPALDRATLSQSGKYVGPRTATERVLTEIWTRALHLERICVFDNFFEVGGNSLTATRVMSRVCSMLNVQLPLRALFESPTIADFAKVVEKSAVGESFVWPTVMKIQPLGTRRPVFFVAAPDTNALGYIRLGDHLGDDQPLYGLQSHKYLKTTTDEHGRPLLEFSQAVVEELANEYVRAMREVQPHGPYLPGGMCRGAHIAFEMATQLKAQGEEVSLLAILDTWVMENTYSYLFYVDYYFNRLKWFLKLGARHKVDFVKNKISRSIDNAAIRFRLREGHGTSLPPVTAVYWPDSSFVPRTYDGRITVFRVPNQPATRIRSHNLGWESRSTRGVDVEVVPGEHQTLMREPHVKVLASRLAKILADIEAGTSKPAS